MSEQKSGVGVNVGFGNKDALMVEIGQVEGVESVEWASPACLHDLYVEVAATADLDTVITLIAAIAGVDDAYQV
jgi:hypothetical protein